MNEDAIEIVEEFLSARLNAPPYVLLFSGLFISLTSGLAFYATFRIQMMLWQQDVLSKILLRRAGLRLIAPFAGVTGGVCILLAALLMSWGVSVFFACVIGFLATISIGYLGWLAIDRRISRRLVQLYLAEQQ